MDDEDLLQVKKLIHERQLRIIIAHLERFMKISGNKPYIKKADGASGYHTDQCRKFVRLETGRDVDPHVSKEAGTYSGK